MRSIRKPLLGALAALVLVGAFVGHAAANRLAFSSQTWRVAFPTAGEPPPGFVSCPFTIEGTLHSRTLSKVSGSLIGYVTRATVAEASCRGGRGRFLTETLPWHVRYESFAGTLPSITAIRGQIIGWGTLLEYAEIPGSSCLYLTSATEPAKFTLSREPVTSIITAFRLDETALIRLASGNSPFCPETAFLSGTTANFTVLGSTARVSVTLVQ